MLNGCGNGEDQSSVMRFVKGIQKNYQQESLPGAELVRKKCTSCHYIDKNLRKIGPSLKGIVGRVPTIEGVPFARWDEQALDAWLQDPSGIKTRTTMVIPGITSQQQRAEIIEYLKQL